MDYVSVVEKIRPSIAKIYSFDASGNIEGTGTGFLFSKAGIMVTCDHVIEKSQSLLCKFSDSTELYSAKVAVRDTEHDLALLKLEKMESRPVLSISKLEEVKSGMGVLFSGFPLKIDTLTTHQGILSAVTVDAVGVTTYLIDGTVNPGNSGCPLLNTKGEVIGVVNATQRENAQLINKVREMSLGAISIHGVDLVEMYKALIRNMQLGIGYAVPASYIPEHKELPSTNPKPDTKKQKTDKKL